MTAIIINLLLLAMSVAVLCPIAVFTVECLAAVLFHRNRATCEKDFSETPFPRTVVLIPAHNEEAVIEETLQSVFVNVGQVANLSTQNHPQTPSEQVSNPSRAAVLVIADNCTDRTAELAERAGAQVLVRTDPARRGKGYALQAAVERLRIDPPDVVVVIDADCHPRPWTIPTLAKTAWTEQRPVQALNLTDRHPPIGAFQAVSILANRFTNLIRPLGLRVLRLPCRLMGTGMAIPWRLIDHAPLAGGSLVEDMQLGIDLALQGHFTLFCPEARVASALPPADAAFVSQRTRWDHGHLRTAAVQIPRLFAAALRRTSWRLFGIAMDLSILPFTLLVALWLGAAILAWTAWLLGASIAPMALLAGGGIALGASLILGWARFCRKQVSPRAVAAVPIYVLRKLPIYTRLLFHREHTWVRTERDRVRTSR